jgi:nicotinamide-nucleotide amidase
MNVNYVRECVRLLATHQKRISCAESATAGHFCSSLSLMPESGKILIGGVVCYDADVKTSLLGIPKAFIDEFTPESSEVTKALVESLPKFFDSEVYLAITGLVSPGGSETPEKPVGTIFIHAKIDDKYYSVRQVFSGSPEQIVLQAVNRAAQCIADALMESESH